MNHSGRRGSVLLLCIAIVTTLTVIAYAFVRMVQLQSESGNSVNRDLLAREATVMGLSHALEQIQRDYIGEPFTRMDGPARAPFASHVYPYYNWHGTDGPASQAAGIDVDDVAGERPLYAPIFGRWVEMQYQGHQTWFHDTSNAETLSPDSSGSLVTYDGRGRYCEPGFINRAVDGGDYAAAQPTVPVRFGDGVLDPATVPLPERSDGLWLDEHWRRVEGGDARAQRSRARYRLRYAVGVMDLDGELLMTGDPAVDAAEIAVADPGASGLTAAAARVIRHQHAVVPLLGTLGSMGKADLTTGARAEHVFIGRGSAANFDRDPGAATPAPLAFPLMYRRLPGTGDVGNHYQWFANDTLAGVTVGPGLARNLYAPAGSVLPRPGAAAPNWNPGQPMKRSLLGAQLSFEDFDLACFGTSGESYGSVDGWMSSLGSLTPFGRGMRTGPPGTFSGAVDTPWRVNIMTAPVGVVRAMVAGYMPRGGMLVRYCPTYTARLAGARSYYAPRECTRDLFVRELYPAFGRYAAPSRPAPAISPDYHLDCDLVDDPGYRPPQNRYPGILAFNGYFPNTFRNAAPARVAAPPNTHPNALWTDMLGRYLRRMPGDESADRGLAIGEEWTGGRSPADPYSGGTVWRSDSGQAASARKGTHNPTGGDYDIWGPGGASYGPHPYSIWDAIGHAMGNAVIIARAQWQQYPTTVTSRPEWQGFDGSATWPGPSWPSPSPPINLKVRCIRDIDALFLANLGIDMANPASTTPYRAWRGLMWNGYQSFLPTHNIASLRTATGAAGPLLGLNDPPLDPTHPMSLYLAGIGLDPNSLEMAALRSQAMEMIVNDFRLAFFGSSPGYGDFLPLDLNGDGKVNCSAYTANAGASVHETACGVDQWAAAGTAVASARCFSPAGMFVMGRSRFWRVMVRGEVWDNLMNKTVSEATLDSVVAVDPVDGANELAAAPADRRPAAGQYATHVMYQRWFFNLYRAHLTRHEQ